MSYRPEGWPKSPCDVCRIRDEVMVARKQITAAWGGPEPECACLEHTQYASREAGADAMLEALRARGFHVDRDAVFCSLGECRTLYNVGNTGTYTFIPDAERGMN